MIRSPPVLRSRSNRDKEEPTADKKKVERSLSAPSDSGLSTMPANNPPPKPADTIVIEGIVNKHLSQGNIFDKLVARMSAEIKTAVEEAVRCAMVAANKEIARLTDEVTSLKGTVKELDERLADKCDELEQYQRRNNIRIYGIPETDGEDTDSLVVKVCQDQLGLNLTEASLCRTHRVGRKPASVDPTEKIRHRPIIVKFISYRDRRLVVNAKKRLKGSGVTVREDLTARRNMVYQEAVTKYGLRHTWTSDGKVLWVDSAGHRGAATRLADLTTSR